MLPNDLDGRLIFAMKDQCHWAGLASPIGTQRVAPVEATLIVTARAIHDVFEKALERSEVSLAEAAILVFVDAHGNPTQTEISNGVGAGRATTGVRIDALEAKGLIEKHPDETDRRVWRITLTVAGEERVRQTNQIDSATRKIVESGLDHNEIESLISTLLHIQSNITRWKGRGRRNGPTSFSEEQEA